LSQDAVTTRAPSGEKAALHAPPWPPSEAIAEPVFAFHSRAIMTSEAVTTREPSGEKAPLSTSP